MKPYLLIIENIPMLITGRLILLALEETDAD